MTRRAATLRAAVAAAVVVAADQGSKAIVRGSIGRTERVGVLPGIDLVNTRNTGVAFGLFSGGGPLLVLVTLLALGGILVFFALNAQRPWAWVPMGLLLGGAAGNLLDRAREGSVTDFIDLPAWPAFNLADIAITLGVVAMFFVLEGPRGRGSPA